MTRLERGRWRSHGRGSCGPGGSGCCLAVAVPGEAEVGGQGERRCVFHVGVVDDDGPQRSGDAFEVVGVGDVLVA
ncbi:MAG TPA: hypothetical protein PLZ93_07645 [Nocardioides sp.]|nr:hypothetical protein [uncultured Nocardioides sp.]HRI95471.1 hypothetical protein [Nocardioides sp.]